MIETSSNATVGFGNGPFEGNRPTTFQLSGLLTFATNYTGIRQLLDKERQPSIYISGLSCFDSPVLDCKREQVPVFPAVNIICLGVINPNEFESKFVASFSFTFGTPLPEFPHAEPAIRTSVSGSSSSTDASTQSTTPTPTDAFFNYGDSLINNKDNKFNLIKTIIIAIIIAMIFSYF
jgi:hypothetical protein